jgi:geranylgeranyl pyrophosphate synthase
MTGKLAEPRTDPARAIELWRDDPAFAGLNRSLELVLKEVNEGLWKALNRLSGPPELLGMIRYQLGFATSDFTPLQPDVPIRRGQRLRSTMAILIARSFNASEEVVRALAIAAEYAHAASLVHDDIQDCDSLRWGRQTAWKAFGIDHAINVGDALIAMTFLELGQLRGLGVPAPLALDAIVAYSKTFFVMTKGQTMDLSGPAESRCSYAEYLRMISFKTASAFSTGCYVSALIGSATPDVADSYASFGEAFGLVYQICDDINSVRQSQERTGKHPLKDIELRKLTLPVIIALQQEETLLRRYVGVDTVWDKSCQADLLSKVVSEEVLHQCRARALEYGQKAVHALSVNINNGSQCNHTLRLITERLCASLGIASAELQI